MLRRVIWVTSIVYFLCVSVIPVKAEETDSVVISQKSESCPGVSKAGERCPNGMVLAGFSVEENVPLYTTPCDAGQTWDGSACTGERGVYDWNEAIEYCDNSFGGHSDWYLPTVKELSVLYLTKSDVGGFSRLYYWSSSHFYKKSAWSQRFKNGDKGSKFKAMKLYVRCVRKGW